MRRVIGILAVLVLVGMGNARAEVPVATRGEVIGVQHWFGVATENIPPAFARQLKLKTGQGLMVVQVYPKSPAEEAKLQKEDLLVEVEGRPLMAQEDLVRAANFVDAKTGAIKPVRIGFLRDGEHLEVTVSGTPRPVDFLAGNAGGNFVAGGVGPESGGVSTIITPNGQAANIGGGTMISLSGAEAQRLKIGTIAKGKENIVMTVSTDEKGVQHHSISVGDKMYVVEKEKLGELPEDLRPLAEQLLKNGLQQTVKQGATAGVTMEQTVAEQQKKIQKLEEQVRELMKGQERK